MLRGLLVSCRQLFVPKLDPLGKITPGGVKQKFHPLSSQPIRTGSKSRSGAANERNKETRNSSKGFLTRSRNEPNPPFRGKRRFASTVLRKPLFTQLDNGGATQTNRNPHRIDRMKNREVLTSEPEAVMPSRELKKQVGSSAQNREGGAVSQNSRKRSPANNHLTTLPTETLNGEGSVQKTERPEPNSPWLRLEEALSVVKGESKDVDSYLSDPISFLNLEEESPSSGKGDMPLLPEKTMEEGNDSPFTAPSRHVRSRIPATQKTNAVKKRIMEEGIQSMEPSSTLNPNADAVLPINARRTSNTKTQVPKISTPQKSKKGQMIMFSAVNHSRFHKNMQDQLRGSMEEMESGSMYWITRAQARRSNNAIVLPGEKPTVIYLSVEAVIPLLAIPKSQQTRILDEHPPFFGTGVGILSDRKKWKVVTAARLVRFLNPKDEDRILFIDIKIADELRLTYQSNNVIDVREDSAVEVFNAKQLDDPFKGEPQKGVAINAITGKRFPQPSHDLLLTVGLLRGYISPMWIGEKQLKYLNIELNPKRKGEGVLASDMSGLIVSLSALPPPCIRLLLKLLKKKYPDAFECDLFFLFGVNGWEASRSRVLVKHMAALEDAKYPYFFVNVQEFAFQFPQLGYPLYQSTKCLKPYGGKYIEEAGAKYAEEEAKAIGLGKKKKKKGPKGQEGGDTLPAGLLFVRKERLWNTTVRCFFAQDATTRRYFNACCMTKPHLVSPSVRSIAICNGRLLGRRDEAILRSHALKYKFSSPLWLTRSTANKMGVDIAHKHLKKFAIIGAEAVDRSGGHSEEIDGFYNIDDFPNNGDILSMFPKSTRNVHFILDGKWRPVLGMFRQEYLSSLKRTTPLWISMSECLMSGFEPRKGAKMCSFPKAGEKKILKGRTVLKPLYNSQQTTDPLRVIGLSTFFTRPQGTHA